MDRMADKSVRNLMDLRHQRPCLLKKYFRTWDRFMGGRSKNWQAFKSIDAIISSYDALVETDEIGEDCFIDFQHFKDQDNVDLIQQLKLAGLCFEKEDEGMDSDLLAGLSIVISGTLINVVVMKSKND